MLTSGTNEAAQRERLKSPGVDEQCATVKELARSRRPRHPRRQLEALRRLQEQDPSTFAVLMQGRTAGAPEDAVREGAEMIALELERWQEHDALLAQAPEAKRLSDRARWAPWLQRYADRIGRELSGSGDAAARAAAMNRVNPKFILRNYLAQRAIADATAGDRGEVTTAPLPVAQPTPCALANWLTLTLPLHVSSHSNPPASAPLHRPDRAVRRAHRARQRLRLRPQAA